MFKNNYFYWFVLFSLFCLSWFFEGVYYQSKLPGLILGILSLYLLYKNVNTKDLNQKSNNIIYFLLIGILIVLIPILKYFGVEIIDHLVLKKSHESYFLYKAISIALFWVIVNFIAYFKWQR